MGWLSKLFGRAEAGDELAFEAGIGDLESSDIVEVDVVGEGSYQEALSRVAGAKQADGKRHRVGVTLRCEPNNQYDANAVRVETMGQLVGYLPRSSAARASDGIARCGGAVEGQGLIVGGWDDGTSEGHFGIRVWLTGDDARRVGIGPRPPVPQLPPARPGEVRLSPADGARDVSTVTVTGEEHHQDAISATRPEGWDREWWPILATLTVADCNPHVAKAAPCVEVRVEGRTAGYLTPAMTDRYLPAVTRALSGADTVTARGQVSRGTKGGMAIWRVQLLMARGS